MPAHQNTYSKFYSTEPTILDLCDNILRNMENDENTAVVTLDLNAVLTQNTHKRIGKLLWHM